MGDLVGRREETTYKCNAIGRGEVRKEHLLEVRTFHGPTATGEESSTLKVSTGESRSNNRRKNRLQRKN